MKAVFFDWDNTLIDTWPTLLEAVNSLLKLYNMPGWSMKLLQENAQLSTRESFPKLFGSSWQEAQTFFQNKVREISKKNLNILPGAKENLDLLKKTTS